MKHLTILLAGLICLVSYGYGQNKKEKKAEKIKSAVTAKTYVFHAQTALPMSGRVRQFTSSYTFAIAGDSIISDLPYFGRAYSAPLDASRSALQFTSVKSDYAATPGKKSGWDISIKFKDVTEVQQAYLSISDDGYGTLRVTCTNRQPISFSGYVSRK